MKQKINVFILMVLLLAMSGGRADSRTRLDMAQRIEAGDLATVDYTVRLADGTLVVSTSDVGQAEMVVAGKKALFPMLGKAVIGMEKDEVKHLTISPESGFGLYDPDQVKTLPVQQKIPQTEQKTMAEVKKRLGSPKTKVRPGMEVPLLPFFKSRIIKIDGQTVTVSHLVKDGSEIDTPIGKTSIRLANGKIVLTLHPTIGAPFVRQGKKGFITAADDREFSVDFNHPLAGKTINLNLKVLKIRKKAQLADIGPIEWQKNLKEAKEVARNRHKPVFLFLYADWCPWCKKLETDVLTDIRIKMLQDDFVWVKVNSDKEQNYKKEYQQRGFPLIVLLDEEGQPVSRIDGFQDSAALRRGLLGWLNTRKRG